MDTNVRSIYDLTTEEAWYLAVNQLGEELPPLDAVENEDWGRDYVLQRIVQHTEEELARVGLTREETPPDDQQGRRT